jgi:putative phosphoribosyl transferase
MGLPYRDRAEAGAELAETLRARPLNDPIVLGVPRGGVAVAAPVASGIGAGLDVVVVRKVGAPRNPELGIGAVGAWGAPWLDERLISTLDVPRTFLEREVETQRDEAKRRVEAYRGTADAPSISGRDVLVIDDGIATGGTVTAAAQLLREQGAGRLILAVPVAPAEAVERLRASYDEVIASYTPEPYMAVGQWYTDFHQVSDGEVRALLAQAERAGRLARQQGLETDRDGPER